MISPAFLILRSVPERFLSARPAGRTVAAVTADQPASAVLCAHGVTPELVEEEIVRRVGLGAGAGLFGGLDKDALATIGIDLDAVRARIEASFGPQALARAAQGRLAQLKHS